MQLTRWDGFRERRMVVIDKYTTAVKNKHRIKLFIDIRFAHLILMKIFDNYMVHKTKR